DLGACPWVRLCSARGVRARSSVVSRHRQRPGMTPYLTVVVGGRNDDYGGNFLGRMQHFVNGIVDAAEGRAQLELVVVDWNPVADAKSLATALDWPPRTRLEIRVIEVPSRIHASLPNAEHMPIFEYIAKNVGIRRARGEYV